MTIAETQARPEDELLALEAELDKARVAGDVVMMEQVLADDFVTTSPTGTKSGKEEMVAGLRSGEMSFLSSSSREIGVRVFGSIAVVTGVAVIKAKFQGRRIDGAYPYTHVYRRGEGGWKVVAAHTSRVMPDWVLFVVMRLLNLFRYGPR